MSDERVSKEYLTHIANNHTQPGVQKIARELLALREQQSADAKDAESWRNYIKAHQLTKEGLNGIHTNAALAKEQNAATHFTEEDAQFCGAVEEYKVKP